MARNALGKGLEALIPGATTETIDGNRAGTKEIPVGRIAPNPFQPRSRFDEASLKELADSIKATGVLQPVLLRRALDGGYQLVAGERRLRAAQYAGLEMIPAIVREVDDREMLELAIVENVQRDGTVSIIYAFGPMGSNARVKGGVLHGAGVIRDGELRFQNSDGSQFAFRPLYSDLEGRLTTSQGQSYQAIFKKTF